MDIRISIFLSDLPTEAQVIFISKLDRKEKVKLFDFLKQEGKVLPVPIKTDRGLSTIEYPDGWQVESDLGWTHRVSKALYGTRKNAYNAFHLDLVDWNELNESPARTKSRAELEDQLALKEFISV
jgi:hypothetical protein